MKGCFAFVGIRGFLRIHIADLPAAYEDLYNPNKAVDPSNVRALPLVFIVLALSVRLAPEEWAGDEQTRKLSSLRMYWSCELSIALSVIAYLQFSEKKYPYRHGCPVRITGAGRHSTIGEPRCLEHDMLN